MNIPARKMPVGILDFEDLRTNGYVYVDKSAYVHNLATMGKPYFLGRPRRFGKSLFLSTLKAFFEGRRELFDGLAIAELEKDWTEYPVIYIDFNRESYIDINSMYSSLDANLRIFEEIWGRDNADTTPAIRFSTLIKRAHEKSGKKVVVLVDEYDKALVSTLDKPELNQQYRDVFKGFYGVLKTEDAHLRFVMLTGVTKFSKVSIFSDLNQLVDISLDEKYSGICGISESELLQTFQPEIAALAEKREMSFDAAFAEMKKRYDGYHFAKVSEDIYNPFSVLNTFLKLDFGSYWYETGTPTILVKQIKDENLDARKFENDITASESEIKDYRPGETSVVPLLFQSGYLTIKNYDRLFDTYTLGFPNEEVRYGFMRNLLPAYAPANLWLMNNFYAGDFIRSLYNGDVEGFMKQLTAFYASIPYDAIKKDDRNEQHFQFIFYLLFKIMGQFVQTEVKSAEGCADAVVWAKDAIYVFEFKMDANATAEDALRQIDDKNYTIPFIADHRKIVKIGVEFSVETGGVKRWIME
jgi:hypothetical protein